MDIDSNGMTSSLDDFEHEREQEQEQEQQPKKQQKKQQKKSVSVTVGWKDYEDRANNGTVEEKHVQYLAMENLLKQHNWVRGPNDRGWEPTWIPKCLTTRAAYVDWMVRNADSTPPKIFIREGVNWKHRIVDEAEHEFQVRWGPIPKLRNSTVSISEKTKAILLAKTGKPFAVTKSRRTPQRKFLSSPYS